MSQPCCAWKKDPHAHVTGDTRATRQKRIDGLAKLSDQELSHYYFLYAAAADCVECTKYWLQNGADTTRGTKHMKYTAKEWAEWTKASEVLEILLSWEKNDSQADGGKLDETMSPSSDTSILFQDAVDSSFWRNAMSEDWKMTKEWCDVRAIVPMAVGLVNRTDSPQRMYHWGVRQYLQFASLCDDAAGKGNDLERIKTMVWQREQEQVSKTMQFIKAVHDSGDFTYTSLINILNGVICFKPSDDTDDASGIVGFGYSCISWKPTCISWKPTTNTYLSNRRNPVTNH